jgi:hypothetical protein
LNTQANSGHLDYVERLIGSIRRECLDHVAVFGEWHLRHVLSCYLREARTHLSLGKDTPVHRPVQAVGRIQARTSPRPPTPPIRADLIYDRRGFVHHAISSEYDNFR